MTAMKTSWTGVVSSVVGVAGICGAIFGAWTTITSAQAVQAAKHEALVARTDRLESDTAQIRRDIKEELKEIRSLIERQLQRSNP